MEMKLDASQVYLPTGGDLAIWQQLAQERDAGAPVVAVSPVRSLLASLFLGTGLCLSAPAVAAAMPAFGTSPSVEDRRPATKVEATPRSAAQASTYQRILVQPFSEQARDVMAALSLTKSQLAGVLRVSRPTIYEWLRGQDPGPTNAGRWSTLLRLLGRAGISSAAPLNARFVRHPISERSPSLLDLLSADDLDEASIEESLREALALGEEAESQRASRENRLRALGYEEPSPEQRREQLDQTVAMLEWPK